MKQDKIFLNFEGDKWFERNKLSLIADENDIILKLLNMYNIKPKKVLEVGASNGYRLAKIYEKYKCRCVAVEPSKKAIKDGKKKFKFIKFIRSVASKMSLRDNSFDLVIVNFVFHWISRESLLKSVAEIDRVLQNYGYLIIGDFFPCNYLKVKYHHLSLEKVYTYKQNYSEIFLHSGLYHLICCITSSHGSTDLNVENNINEKAGWSLLQKAVDNFYLEKPLKIYK